MKEPPQAIFNFNSYRIKEFCLHDAAAEGTQLSIAFDPSGIFLINSNTFVLRLGFKALFSNEADPSISAILEAQFSFKNVNSLEEIPEFFYTNSIAIIFPYLRAFITTLTSVAGLPPLILPTLNLTNLSADFKKNTKAENA